MLGNIQPSKNRGVRKKDGGRKNNLVQFFHMICSRVISDTPRAARHFWTVISLNPSASLSAAKVSSYQVVGAVMAFVNYLPKAHAE